MNKLLIALCFLLGSNAFAAGKTYDLKMEVSINGKKVFSPHVTTKEGEMASFTQDSTGQKAFVEVIATEASATNAKGIMMNFVIGMISADGKRTILSTPQITTLENQSAQIQQSGEKGKDSIAVSVVAKRI